MKDFSPLARQNNLVVQELKDELLIYDLQTNKCFCLNQTSTAIWYLCDGKNSISEISRQLSKKLARTVSEDLIWLAIDLLKQENLLIESNKITIDFQGLSRREAIKKAGLASMIALPLITSIIAPKAVNAQSVAACTPDGGACSLGNPGACCSKACTQPAPGTAFCCTSAPGPFQCFV